MSKKTYKLSEISDFLGGQLEGDPSKSITDIGTLSEAHESSISFIYNKKFLNDLKSTAAAAVLLSEEYKEHCHRDFILVSNPHEEFTKIAEYLSKLTKMKIEDGKILMAIKNNNFENLKKIENKDGFVEAANDKNTGKTKSFFNLGPNNKWQEKLDIEIRQSIEEKFEIEMKELGYL